MTCVYVVGVAVVDYVFTVADFPSGAEKYRAEHATVVGGGCGANAAVAITRLGGTALLAARLGGDPVGEAILSDLRREGVDVSHCDRTGEISSFSSVLVNGEGERQIVNFRGAGLVESTGHLAPPPETDAILADTRWSAGALAAMETARERGIPGVLDIEAPAERAPFDAASHLAFSEQGLAHFHPDLSPEEAITQIAATHGGWVCVTRGADGVNYCGPDGAGHIPAYKVVTVDTLGAGDVWHGAFAMRLGEGADEISAVRFANAVSAIKCTRRGGRSGTPTRAETDAFIKETEPFN